MGLLALMLLVVSPAVVSALTPSQMNLSDATIIEQTADTVTVSFLLENRSQSPQLDVRYTFELMQNVPDGGQVAFDTWTPGTTLTFEAGQSIEVKDRFSIAHLPPGIYDLWITAWTTGGAPLGLGMAGSVEVAGPRDMVEIMADTCFLRVAEDETATRFLINQGVDVKPEETLIMQCRVKNHSRETARVVPQYETYWRMVFGQLMASTKDAEATLELAAGEERLVDFPIPLGLVPQSYNTVISLLDFASTELRSNRIVTRHVLRGMSATIQNVALDQFNYSAGEDIAVTIDWTGPADNFPNTRFPATAMTGPLLAEVLVKDINGQVCTDTAQQALSQATTETIILPAKIDCVAPQAVVVLRGENKQALDTRTVSNPLIIESEPPVEAERQATSGWLKYVSLVLLVLLGIIIVTYMIKYKRQTGSKMLIFALLLAASITLGGEKVEAVTWYHWSTFCWTDYRAEGQPSHCRSGYSHTVTANTDQTSYQPGEEIILTANSIATHCVNPAYKWTIRAILEDQEETVNVRLGPVTIPLVAPSEPGVYTIELGFAEHWGRPITPVGLLQIRVDPPIVEADLTVPNCEILAGESSCTTAVAWTSSGTSRIEVLQDFELFSTAVSSLGVTRTLKYGSGPANSFVVRSGASELASLTGVATCVAGTAWTEDEEICAPLPDPEAESLTLSPNPAPWGSSYGLSFTFANANSCSIESKTNNATTYSNRQCLAVNSSGLGVLNLASYAVAGSDGLALGLNQYRLTCYATVQDCANNINPSNRIVADFTISSNGACGSAARDYSFSETSYTEALCASGNPSPASPSFPSQGGSESWQCLGTGGGLPSPVCTAQRLLPPAPQLNVSNCVITSVNQSTCTAVASWNLQAGASPYEVRNMTTNTVIGTASTSLSTYTTLTHGVNEVRARASGLTGLAGGLDVISAFPMASCGAGLFWHQTFGACTVYPQVVVPPEIQNQWIRSGQTAPVRFTVTAPYPVICRINGGNTSPASYAHPGGSTDYEGRTGVLTAAQIVQITCQPTGMVASDVVREARITILPMVQEL